MKTLVAAALLIAAINASFLHDCTRLADGLYSLGDCEPRFLTCSGGIPRIMDCPDDLVYHASQEICDWRHNVFACGAAPEEESSGIESGDGSGIENETGSGDSSGESSGDEILQNVCEYREDGVYSSGTCSNYFFVCTSNSPRYLTCTTPLHYDPVEQKCSWKSTITECNEEIQTTTETIAPVEEKQNSGYGSYEESSSGEGSGETTPSCENKADGIFPIDGCSTNFLTCSGGIARLMDCPSSLVFNPSLLVCDWRRSVEGCSELPEPAQCGKDGYYSFGECSSTFTACTNGNSVVMFCPSGLKFSEGTQMCDYEHNVQECRGGSGEGSGESSGEANGYGNEDLLTPCINMENGLYALECTPRVLSCQNGHEDIFECPSTLVFNEQSLICDFPETSLKCQIEDHLLIRDSAVATYDCSVDGVFSSALCSRSYHKCSNGNLIKHECADSNAVFSTVDATCVDSSTLPQCQ
ncbi:hypothetical protein CAEBREN_08043 [Caenorhabditis brenneri]|uniref:Chitin-binding type-2 domain-containing protein n=1 Tax=Caenorhabditis brenneri TaxID=135651 RepID=G0MPN8_CAEBE|nr:hypothetical protein CAEBREN_08043 [Caenorhabditis brenneri]